jgi:hypothetical protein
MQECSGLLTPHYSAQYSMLRLTQRNRASLDFGVSNIAC